MMSPEGIGRLVEEHAAALTLYARQWCSVPEDVVQEAFLKLVTQRSPPQKPVAWLYRVVRNAAISAARSSRRRQHHETAAAAQAPAWFVDSESALLDVRAANEALLTFPLEQREVIVAHLWGGLTFEEIAELIGSSASTAHRWYVARLTGICPRENLVRILLYDRSHTQYARKWRSRDRFASGRRIPLWGPEPWPMYR